MEGPAYGRPCRPQRQEVTEKSRSPLTYCCSLMSMKARPRDGPASSAEDASLPARLLPLRRADEDHRLRDRGGFRSPYPRPPRRAHPTSAHRAGRPRSSPGRRTSNPAKALTSASHHPSMSSISGELVGTMPLRTFLRANVTQPAPADLCLDIRPSAIRRPKAPTITRNPAGIGPKASYRPRAGRRITGRPVRRNSSCLFPVASHSSSHGGPGHREPATPTDPRPRP
jgi:hypothetical protein